MSVKHRLMRICSYSDNFLRPILKLYYKQFNIMEYFYEFTLVTCFVNKQKCRRTVMPLHKCSLLLSNNLKIKMLAFQINSNENKNIHKIKV